MDRRLLAVGDVHGCRAELERLLDALAPTPADRLVFLGDYVDRGPDSGGVLDRLLVLRDAAEAGDGPACTFLRGNHEQMMLDARREGGHTLENWLYNGGGATLLSYGHPPSLKTHHHLAGERPEPGWEALVPEAHWAFLEATVFYLDHPAYLFVHAGADPALTLAENLRGRPGRFLWERQHLAAGADLSVWEKAVVCGHTPSSEPVDRPRLVVIDQGAYLPYLEGRPGALTAVVLPPDGVGARSFVRVAAGQGRPDGLSSRSRRCSRH